MKLQVEESQPFQNFKVYNSIGLVMNGNTLAFSQNDAGVKWGTITVRYVMIRTYIFTDYTLYISAPTQFNVINSRRSQSDAVCSARPMYI